MISQRLAADLREAGLRWIPAAGDRFVIPQPGLDDEVFTLSEMTIEAREHPTGTILGFNGTTEWALDSVAMDEALWMPREDQLRELLGGTFVSLARESQDDGEGHQYTVTTRAEDGEQQFSDASAVEAYGFALRALIAHAMEGVRA